MTTPKVIKEKTLMILPMEARFTQSGTPLPSDTALVQSVIVQGHDVDKVKSLVELCCVIAAIFIKVFYKASLLSAVTRLMGNWGQVSRAIQLAGIVISNLQELKDELFDITAEEAAEIYAHINKVVTEELSNVR